MCRLCGKLAVFGLFLGILATISIIVMIVPFLWKDQLPRITISEGEYNINKAINRVWKTKKYS